MKIVLMSALSVGFYVAGFAQTSGFRQLTNEEVVLDMKYATTDNFLGEAVYDCADCYLREEVANAVLKAQAYFIERGYTLHVFDCYRPRRVQYKMWAKVSDPQYVADPRKGSIHNRGGAIDLSLATKDGKLLDMGTGFDHFGPEAHRSYTKLTPEQLANRQLLQHGMEQAGFTGLPSEWWHFDWKGSSQFPIADFDWTCD